MSKLSDAVLIFKFMEGSFGLLTQLRLDGSVASIFLYYRPEVSIESILINYLAQSAVMAVKRSIGEATRHSSAWHHAIQLWTWN
jgi:hypothetical protein